MTRMVVLVVILGTARVAAAQLAVTPATVDFGAVRLGATSAAMPVRIENRSGAMVGVNAVSSDQAQFPVIDPPGAPIQVEPGGSATIMVACRPMGASGALAAQLLADSTGGDTAMAELRCQAVAPDLQLSSDMVEFGPSRVGDTVRRAVTFRNAGGAPLAVELRLGGPQADRFQLDPAGAFTVAAGGTRDVTIAYTPRRTGSDDGMPWMQENNAQIDVTSDSETPPNPIRVTATAVVPGLNVAPEGEADFGSIYNGAQSEPVTIGLQNATQYPLTITSVKITGPQAAEFALVDDPTGDRLDGNGELRFRMVFRAMGVQNREALLTISTDVPEARATLQLRGDGRSTMREPGKAGCAAASSGGAGAAGLLVIGVILLTRRRRV